MNNRTGDENFLIVSTAEEYAFLHKMEMPDVLRLFRANRIGERIREQYDVLHMSDIRDSISMAESIIGRYSVE